MRDRAEEVDAVAHAGRSGDRSEAISLALFAPTLRCVPRVLSEDDQPDVVVLAVAQQRKGANRDLGALQPLEPAHEQEQPALLVADLAPRFFAVEGLEHREVDPCRNDRHALWA